MSTGDEIAVLFRRDLTRLTQELRAFGDDGPLWEVREGITNSAGNLTLHLEGNLREYIGRQLGKIAYERRRSEEFKTTGLAARELVGRIEELESLIPPVISSLSTEQLAADYPETVFRRTISTGQFLIHLHGHLNFHLGQIDYLRRILMKDKAIEFVEL